MLVILKRLKPSLKSLNFRFGFNFYSIKCINSLTLVLILQCFHVLLKGSLHEKKTEIVWSFAKPGVGGYPTTKLLSGFRLFPWKKTEIVQNFAKGGVPPFGEKTNYFRFFLVKASLRAYSHCNLRHIATATQGIQPLQLRANSRYNLGHIAAATYGIQPL